MRPLTALALFLTAALLGACGGATRAFSPAHAQSPAAQNLSFDPGRVSQPARARIAASKQPPQARTAAQSRRRATVAAPVSPPPIVQRHIPYGTRRLREMAAYARRHYGISSSRLTNPKVIVEHYTETSTAKAAIAIFAPDVADTELHELPGVCAHFVIDRAGTIYQLVRLSVMCRHTVGLNYTSIGIEMVGFSDRQILGNARQLRASLRLTRWLRCRFNISLRNVIGHNESRSSPYHRERVARLRNQTHSDWNRADMNVYRAKLARTGCG